MFGVSRLELIFDYYLMFQIDPIKQELISRLEAFRDQAMQRRGVSKGLSSAFFRLNEKIPVGRSDEYYVNLFLEHLETCSSIHDAYRLTCEQTLNNLDSLNDKELICIIKESLDRVDQPAAAGFCRK